MKRIIALGFFDGVHLGHRSLLARTRCLADEQGALACALTFDRSPGKSGLLTTLSERTRLLQSLGQMDEVLALPFDEGLKSTPWDVFADHLLRRYDAAALVCGWDYRFGAEAAGTAVLLSQYCAARGVRCDVMPPVVVEGQTVSSTLLKTLVTSGDMERAAKLYGHPHTLSGTVVSGQGLGRRLGFPTANLLPEPELLLPKTGVYAVRAQVGGMLYTGVCNVGSRPTVGGDGVRVETWLAGFSGDLYGKTLTLDFHKYLRPEKKFASLDALREEILRNQQQAAAYFDAC